MSRHVTVRVVEGDGEVDIVAWARLFAAELVRLEREGKLDDLIGPVAHPHRAALR